MKIIEKYKFYFIEKIDENFKLNNRPEEQNLYSVGLLSAIKYDDIRKELCGDVMKNSQALPTTSNLPAKAKKKVIPMSKVIGNPKLLDIKKIKKEKPKEKTFTLQMQKRFMTNFVQKNHTKKQNQINSVQNGSLNKKIKNRKTEEESKSETNIKVNKTPSSPKKENTGPELPLADISKVNYKDDGDYLMYQVKSIIKKIRSKPIYNIISLFMYLRFL